MLQASGSLQVLGVWRRAGLLAALLRCRRLDPICVNGSRTNHQRLYFLRGPSGLHQPSSKACLRGHAAQPVANCWTSVFIATSVRSAWNMCPATRAFRHFSGSTAVDDGAEKDAKASDARQFTISSSDWKCKLVQQRNHRRLYLPPPCHHNRRFYGRHLRHQRHECSHRHHHLSTVRSRHVMKHDSFHVPDHPHRQDHRTAVVNDNLVAERTVMQMRTCALPAVGHLASSTPAAEAVSSRSAFYSLYV